MNAPAPAGSFGGAGNGLQQQDNQRLFQIVLHDLKQNWNPQGWQREMQPTERASTIIQMYVATRFPSFFKPKRPARFSQVFTRRLGMPFVVKA